MSEVRQIIGKGGLAREIAVYMADDFFQPEVRLFEYECEGISPHYPTIIAIGDGRIRKKVAEKFSAQGYDLLEWGVYVVGRAYDVQYGKGFICCPGSTLTTNIRIGDHVLINIGCSVGHDCIIGDYSSLAPGVNVSGKVTIGNLVTIGSNAVICPGVTICDEAIIAAGAVIAKDIIHPGLHFGAVNRKQYET